MNIQGAQQAKASPEERTLFLISTLVVAAHILFLFFTAIASPRPIQNPPKQLIVQTVTLNQPVKTIVKEQHKPIEKNSPPPVQQAVASEPEPEVIEEIEEKVIPSPTPAKEVQKVDKKKPKPKVTPPKKTASKSKPTAAKKSAPVPKAKPVKKEAKTETKKISKSQPKPNPQAEAAQAKQRALLAQAEKSIAKIGQTRDKMSASSAVSSTLENIPAAITSLNVEAIIGEPIQSLSPREQGYYEELASRLKLLLRLPEYGEVKIKLTLERSGQFIKVSTVTAESTANKKYVEKTIPTLSYPGFGNNFEGQEQHIFVIVLSNDL